MDNYCIKSGYKANAINLTNDKFNEENYWNEHRRKAAEMYQFPVYQFLSDFIRQNKISRVIDVGCGVGRKLVYVNKKNPAAEIIGIDQDDPIKYCNSAYNFGKWYSDDFEDTHLSQDLNSELIICSDVIEHLADPDLLLRYIKSRLCSGGIVIFSTPERDLLRGKDCNFCQNKNHIREWNRIEFAKYLESRGFHVLQHFLQYPVKITLSAIFFREIVKRALRLKPIKYNQVVLARLK